MIIRENKQFEIIKDDNFFGDVIRNKQTGEKLQTRINDNVRLATVWKVSKALERELPSIWLRYYDAHQIGIKVGTYSVYYEFKSGDDEVVFATYDKAIEGVKKIKPHVLTGNSSPYFLK